MDTVVKRMQLAEAFIHGSLADFKDIQALGYDGIVYDATDTQVEQMYARVFGLEPVREKVPVEERKKLRKLLKDAEKRMDSFKCGEESIKFSDGRITDIQQVLCFHGMWATGVSVLCDTLEHVDLKESCSVDGTHLSRQVVLNELGESLLSLVGTHLEDGIAVRDMAAYSFLYLISPASDPRESNLTSVGNGRAQCRSVTTHEYMALSMSEWEGKRFSRYPSLTEYERLRVPRWGTYEMNPEYVRCPSYRKPKLYFQRLFGTGDTFDGICLKFTICDGGYALKDLKKITPVKLYGGAVDAVDGCTKTLKDVVGICEKEGIPFTEYVMTLPLSLDEAISFCSIFGLGEECGVAGFATNGELRKALCDIKEHEDALLNGVAGLMDAQGILW